MEVKQKLPTKTHHIGHNKFSSNDPASSNSQLNERIPDIFQLNFGNSARDLQYWAYVRRFKMFLFYFFSSGELKPTSITEALLFCFERIELAEVQKINPQKQRWQEKNPRIRMSSDKKQWMAP